jgi:hypothetical protein
MKVINGSKECSVYLVFLQSHFLVEEDEVHLGEDEGRLM